ncbi:MAG: 4Fe-4S binding protein [Limisphaerales bacterium]
MKAPRIRRVLLALFLAWTFCADAFAERRFPPPDFESGYKLPATPMPPARVLLLEYLDVAVLVAALGLAAFLVYRKRSRKGVLALSIFSLGYFGFYREGCVCAIGSIQNVTLALFEPGYAVPLTVVAFFAVPLAATLFFGRTFCAAVCPHGALQDLALLKPVRVPSWLEEALGVLAYVYLGAAVLFAATGSAFIICRLDPFVAIFRRTGSFNLLMLGAVFLLAGIFIGRPYCRFLCPYGALLRLAAMVSKWRVAITPDQCTQCRLCEESCPYGAIQKPAPVPLRLGGLSADRRRLAGLLVLAPALLVGGGWVGSKLSVAASRVDSRVALAERFVRESKTPVPANSNAAADLALVRAEQTPREVLTTALAVRHRFVVGGWIFGAWVGLVIGATLLRWSVWRKRVDFEPDGGRCFACARCFEFCPQERLRRFQLSGTPTLNGLPSGLLAGAPTASSQTAAVPKVALPQR